MRLGLPIRRILEESPDGPGFFTFWLTLTSLRHTIPAFASPKPFPPRGQETPIPKAKPDYLSRFEMQAEK